MSKGIYYKIDCEECRRLGLSGTDKDVYFFVKSFKDGLTMGQQKIADYIPTSVDSVKRSLRKLTHMGLIVKCESDVEYSGGKLLMYTINPTSKMHEGVGQNARGATGKMHEGVGQNARGATGKLHEGTPYIITSNITSNKQVIGGNRAPAHACEAPPENPTSDKEKKIEEIVLAKWNAHYRRHYSTEYIPDYRSITNDTAVIADAVRKKMSEHGRSPGDTDDAKQFCDDLFESFRTVADLWQRQHWTLHTIATQFNELYNRIINGNNPDPDNNTATNRPGKGQRRISDAKLKEAMRKAAGIVQP